MIFIIPEQTRGAWLTPVVTRDVSPALEEMKSVELAFKQVLI